MQFFLVLPKGSMYYAQHRYQWSMEIYIFILKKKGLELHDQLLCVKKTPDLHLHKLESIRWI